MSEENVAMLRRAFDAWNRNDWESLMACYAPDVITVPPAEWPEAETGTNRETLRRQFEQTKAPWEEERVEVDEIRDLGGDRVLAFYRWSGRGKGSHAEVEHPIATLHTLRGGRIVRIEYFLDQPSALEAAGVRSGRSVSFSRGGVQRGGSPLPGTTDGDSVFHPDALAARRP